MSSLGDVLLTSPVIRALRKKFPKSQIDFLVRKEYCDIVRYNPNLSRILEFEVDSGTPTLWQLGKRIRKEKYDIILDLHKNFRSNFLCFTAGFFSGRKPKVYWVKKNQITRFLLVKFKINVYKIINRRITKVWEKYLLTAKNLNLTSDKKGLELYLSPEVNEFYKQLSEDILHKTKPLVIAPGAKHFTKRWPTQFFAELITRVNEKYGISPLLVGGAEDVDVVDEILSLIKYGAAFSLAGNHTVLQTAAIIKNASFFIGNDSGLTHVAAAFKIPTIAIFGSTVEEFGFFPENPRAIVLENKSIKCRPCTHIGKSTCPQGHFRCMEDVTVEMVLEKLEELLKQV